VLIGALAVGALALGVGLGMVFGSAAQPPKTGNVAAAGTPTPPPPSEGQSPAPATGSASPGASAGAESPGSSPTATPTATPAPTPVLVADPLDGVPVKPAIAARHVIAVMIDDQSDARPQSGLSQASVVWQAPAEGGIPRYMAFFSEGTPANLGPVRSSRLYFIAWASEWNSIYVHAGGSPQAMAYLNSTNGKGKVVWNADALRGVNFLFHRISTRFAPHNLYTDAKDFRRLVGHFTAKPIKNPKPVWLFAPDAPLAQRPVGGKIVVPYPANVITYQYDRATNTYLRTVTGEGKQMDVGVSPKVRIAPKNVLVMTVPFLPTGDHKHRLDAVVVGTGKAWIFTNGTVTQGTWKKSSFNGPTRFFDAKGNPVTLTIGQTFVQVVPRGTVITIKKGTPPPPATSPTPSPSPSPGT
jgi:hypothetical protein